MSIQPRTADSIFPAAMGVRSTLILLGLFVALNLADVVLTHINVSIGISSEANPFLLGVIERFGWTGLYGFKVLGPILLIAGILLFSRITESHRFSYFLVVICLLSLSGVCSGLYVTTRVWIN